MTWFNEEGSKERSLLYKLEDMKIVKLCQEREKKKGQYKYEWKLTDKGKKLVDGSEILQEIWGDGLNIDVISFYNEVLKSEKTK